MVQEKEEHVSVNLSVCHSVILSFCHSINQSVCHSVFLLSPCLSISLHSVQLSVCPSRHLLVNKSVSQPANQLVCLSRSVSQSVSRSVCLSASRSFCYLPVSQSISQSVSQPASQSVMHSFIHFGHFYSAPSTHILLRGAAD